MPAESNPLSISLHFSPDYYKPEISDEFSPFILNRTFFDSIFNNLEQFNTIERSKIIFLLMKMIAFCLKSGPKSEEINFYCDTLFEVRKIGYLPDYKWDGLMLEDAFYPIANFTVPEGFSISTLEKLHELKLVFYMDDLNAAIFKVQFENEFRDFCGNTPLHLLILCLLYKVENYRVWIDAVKEIGGLKSVALMDGVDFNQPNQLGKTPKDYLAMARIRYEINFEDSQIYLKQERNAHSPLHFFRSKTSKAASSSFDGAPNKVLNEHPSSPPPPPKPSRKGTESNLLHRARSMFSPAPERRVSKSTQENYLVKNGSFYR